MLMTRLMLAAAVCCALSSCAASDRRPTIDDLHNATIRGITTDPITLQDGVFEGPPFQPGAASRLRVTLLGDPVAFTDLDGTPGDGAAVLVDASGGGSGSSVYVAVFHRRADRLTNSATALVGDRVQIRALSIVDRAVTIDVVEAGPEDALCCPSRLARKSYAFHDARLRLMSSLVTGALSLATLAGREWTLVRLEEQPLPHGARPPTITFDVTRVSGFAGCNHFTGQAGERTPGTIVLGQLATTNMACPSPAMEVEDRYLAALATVSQYRFVAGRLLLSGGKEGTTRRLAFDRSPP